MASTLSIPRDVDNVPVGLGVWSSGGTPTAAWLRILAAAVLGTEETPSGALSVGGMELHDAAETTTIGPVKIGGISSAAAPTSVNADGDIVKAWFLRNGAQATVLTAAGALIGGDATNGLDVDVTRLSVEVVDDAAFTPATSKVAMVGFEADEGSTDSVDEGDGGAARMTLDRKLISTPQPHTQGGLDTFNASGADGAQTTALVATAVAVKASAGQLYGWYIYNSNDEVSYVNFYDIAQGSVTVGSSNVKLQLAIPAGAGANVMGTHGIPFGTAITVSATKTEGTNTAPDAGLSVQLFYK
jgi:hypothetical protein